MSRKVLGFVALIGLPAALWAQAANVDVCDRLLDLPHASD